MKKLFLIASVFISLFASAQTIKQKQVDNLGDSLAKKVDSTAIRNDSLFQYKNGTEYFRAYIPSTSLQSTLQTKYAPISVLRKMYAEASPALTSANWSLVTSTVRSDHWADGVKAVTIDNVIYLLGGWYNGGGPAETYNTILKSSDGGATWSTHSATLPFAGHAFIVIQGSDDYIYIIGSDHLGTSTERKTVRRTRDMTTFETMTTNAQWGDRMLAAGVEYNGKLYVMGGETTAFVAKNDVWVSTDYGKNWTLVADNINISSDYFLGRNINEHVQHFNGRVYVVGGGVYDDNPANRTYSTKVYSTEDFVNWKVESDAPFAAQYGNTYVWDGKLWYMFGAASGGNISNVAYLDKNGIWYNYVNYINNAPASVLSPTHAAALTLYKDGLIRICGNGTNDAYKITRSNMMNGLVGRNNIRINSYTALSETKDALGTILGNSVTSDPSVSSGIMKISGDNGQWVRLNYNTGISFHTGLSGSNGTTAVASDNMRMKIDNSGIVTAYNGLVLDAGNLVTNGEFYHQGYAGSGVKALKIEADGKVKPIPAGSDGQVLTLVSGVPAWADATGGGGGGGSTNSNIGLGYRWAVPGTNNIKTTFGANGILIDSTSNTNTLTFQVDSSIYATKAYAASLSGGGSPALTQYQVGHGDASNLLTGANNFLFKNNQIVIGDTDYDGKSTTGIYTTKNIRIVGNDQTGNDDPMPHLAIRNTATTGNVYSDIRVSSGGGYAAGDPDLFIGTRDLSTSGYGVVGTNSNHEIRIRPNLQSAAIFKPSGDVVFPGFAGLGTTRFFTFDNTGKHTFTSFTPSDVVLRTELQDTASAIRSAIGGGGSSTFAGLTDVNLTSPANNDIAVFDGTDWVNKTPAQVRTILKTPTTLNVQYTDAANSGTSETDLMSYTIPANTLVNNGDRLVIRAHFTTVSNANNKTLKFKFGSSTQEWTPSTITSGTDITVEVEIIRSASGAQKISRKFITSFTTLVGFATGGETDTAGIVLKFTGQSNTASNDIVQKTMSITYYPAP